MSRKNSVKRTAGVRNRTVFSRIQRLNYAFTTGYANGTILAERFWEKFTIMFRNYFKIAWRSLLKDRQFSLLNILGLSAGICCALLIWLWVADELSVDKFFPNENRIYEVMESNRVNGQQQMSDESSGLVADLLIAQFPEVE